MDILGIGPLELFFIILIALIVLGPKDMVKAGRSIGRTMRKIVTSENWRTIQQASHEIRNIPTRLMREAGLEDAKKEIAAATNIAVGPETKNKPVVTEPAKADLSAWTTPQNTIAPPTSGSDPTEATETD
jgi:sec-independent protein translocase protein TatB